MGRLKTLEKRAAWAFLGVAGEGVASQARVGVSGFGVLMCSVCVWDIFCIYYALYTCGAPIHEVTVQKPWWFKLKDGFDPRAPTKLEGRRSAAFGSTPSPARHHRFPPPVPRSSHEFEVRGLGKAEIKKAFKRRALELHPDKGGDADRFRLLQDGVEGRCLVPRSGRGINGAFLAAFLGGLM